jgi:hypothetical protein
MAVDLSPIARVRRRDILQLEMFWAYDSSVVTGTGKPRQAGPGLFPFSGLQPHSIMMARSS